MALPQLVADWGGARKARQGHWGGPAWRGQRFRALVLKKKSEARLFARVLELAGAAGGARPLVPPGGWAMHPGPRCGPPTPGAGLARRMVAAGFGAALVHEAMASMNFYATGGGPWARAWPARQAHIYFFWPPTLRNTGPKK